EVVAVARSRPLVEVELVVALARGQRIGDEGRPATLAFRDDEAALPKRFPSGSAAGATAGRRGTRAGARAEGSCRRLPSPFPSGAVPLGAAFVASFVRPSDGDSPPRQTRRVTHESPREHAGMRVETAR